MTIETLLGFFLHAQVLRDFGREWQRWVTLISLIVANVVALNFPMGMALGVMALRSRGLLLPTVVHVSLHIMKDAVM